MNNPLHQPTTQESARIDSTQSEPLLKLYKKYYELQGMLHPVIPETLDLSEADLYRFIMATPQVAESSPANPKPETPGKTLEVPAGKTPPQKSAKGPGVSKTVVASVVNP